MNNRYRGRNVGQRLRKYFQLFAQTLGCVHLFASLAKRLVQHEFVVPQLGKMDIKDQSVRKVHVSWRL